MIDRSAVVRLLKSAWNGARKAPGWVLRQWRDPVRRDRAAATASFVLIGAFTLASIDYLICGGLDWNPGGEAYAVEMPQQPQLPHRVSAPAPEAVLELPPTPALAEAALEATDYSVAAEDLLGGPEEPARTALAEFSAEQPISIEFVEPQPRAWFVSKAAVPD
jgi:hypothetical protein